MMEREDGFTKSAPAVSIFLGSLFSGLAEGAMAGSPGATPQRVGFVQVERVVLNALAMECGQAA
jgi:hypothetical protein